MRRVGAVERVLRLRRAGRSRAPGRSAGRRCIRLDEALGDVDLVAGSGRSRRRCRSTLVQRDRRGRRRRSARRSAARRRAKRIHIPAPGEGGRSSSMACRQRSAHRDGSERAPPPGGARVRRRVASRSACAAPHRRGTLARVLSARNRELLGLVPVGAARHRRLHGDLHPGRNSAPGASTNLTLNHASSVSLTYGRSSSALCLAAHLVIRFALPHADPYLFPLGAVLASVGIVMVYRIDPVLARQQAQWMVLGLVLFAATILALRSARRRRARALSLHDRRGRHRHDGAAAPARDRRAGQRRLPGHPLRQRLLSAVRAREGRDRDLPRQLPARQPPAARHRRPARARADDPADEAVRADADRVGRGDGHAAADARAGHLADVLRRVPRAAVRRHRALLVPVHRPGAVRGRRVVRGRRTSATCTRACSPGNTPSTRRSTTALRRQLPARAVAVRAGRRRSARAPASTSRCCACRTTAGRSCRCPKAT